MPDMGKRIRAEILYDNKVVKTGSFERLEFAPCGG